MKIFYTIFLSLIGLSLFAQVAPDFTVTDTKGVEHKLYADYLDQGKTVVLDLFFVDCPPCNELAPLMEPLYQEWGAGQHDVEFISLTSMSGDDDVKVIGFEEQHGTTWPAVSADGGGPEAQAPYTDGSYGPFYGYPTLVIIAPDRSVQFDAWVNGNFPATIDLLDEWISNTGVSKPIVSIDELDNVQSFSIAPNPVANEANLNISLTEDAESKIAIFNNLGQQVSTVFEGKLNAGNQIIKMPTEELTSGTFFIKVTMNNKTSMQQFVKF